MACPEACLEGWFVPAILAPGRHVETISTLPNWARMRLRRARASHVSHVTDDPDAAARWRLVIARFFKFGLKFPAFTVHGTAVASTTESRAIDPLLMGSPRVGLMFERPSDARPLPEGVGTRDRISRGERHLDD
jgi:hypothetical protein